MAQRIMRLLQVEDDPNEVYFFNWVIRRWDVPIASQVVTSAAAALEYLDSLGKEAQTLDLVLLDISMPQMSGFDLLKALKAREPLSKVPIVMFSNSSHSSDVARARQLGADSYVVKPDDPSVLAEILRFVHRCWERHEVLRLWPDEAAPIVPGRLSPPATRLSA